MEFRRWYLVLSLFMCWSLFYRFNLYPGHDKWIAGTVKLTLITVRDIAGNIILSRSTDKLREPLGRWKPREEVLAFIHIGKAGGTSFERALKESTLKENQCRMKCSQNLEQLKINQPKCPEIKPMLCSIFQVSWQLVTNLI